MSIDLLAPTLELIILGFTVLIVISGLVAVTVVFAAGFRRMVNPG